MLHSFFPKGLLLQRLGQREKPLRTADGPHFQVALQEGAVGDFRVGRTFRLLGTFPMESIPDRPRLSAKCPSQSRVGDALDTPDSGNGDFGKQIIEISAYKGTLSG